MLGDLYEEEINTDQSGAMDRPGSRGGSEYRHVCFLVELSASSRFSLLER